MRDLADPPFLPACALRRLVGSDAAGQPLVADAEGGPGTPARSLVELGPGAVGAEVAVLELAGAARGLLILGLPLPPAKVAEADGERVVLEGRREVVLRCGGASITLKPDGSVTVRGTRILSRAEGANRMQGGSVELN